MVKTNPPDTREDEWNEWYNRVHVGAREKMEGFLSARRFKKLENFPDDPSAPEAKYLALYDLTNEEILKSEAYQRLRQSEAARGSDSFDVTISTLPGITRGLYELKSPDMNYLVPGTGYVFVVGHDVPQNYEEEFNAWYNTEHLPAILKVQGVVSGRRFKLLESGMPGDDRKHLPPTYLSVYDIESPGVLESTGFVQAASTPWTKWVRSWYTRRMRMVYRQIYP